MFLSVDHIVQSGGLLAIGLIIFAETGLLIGFFLPGDTLLVAAGIIASQHTLPLAALLPIAAFAAIAGYQVGYIIGERAGPRIFNRKDGLLFREEYITRTSDFFIRHGGKSILLARFIAVVRTIVPLVAGVGKMDKRRFAFYNVVGGMLWTTSLILASYWLGKHVANIDKYLIYLVLAAMVLTSGSVAMGILKSRSRRREFKNALLDEFNFFFRKKSRK